jgi:hypothetical protein
MKCVCKICGSTKATDDPGEVCNYLCYWQIEGWLGWNGKRKKVAIRDLRAMIFVPGHTAGKVSYKRMIAMARDLGWNGRENAGTLVAESPVFMSTKVIG